MVIKKHIFSFVFLCAFLFVQKNGSFAFETKRCDIPPDMANVNDVSDYQTEKLVYYIHDAHCQPEAQYTIAKLIERIIAYHGDAVISVEGAYGKFEADIFKKFPDKQALLDVSKKFVDNGSISGAEYLFLTSKRDIFLVGTENPACYIENHNRMTGLLKIQNNAVNSVENLILETLFLARKTLNDNQNEFIKNWSDYKKGEIDLKEFTVYLNGFYTGTGYNIDKFTEIKKYLDACSLEENINFDAVESERLSFFDWFTARADKDELAGLFTADLNYQLKKITPKEYFSNITGLAEKNGYTPKLLQEIISYNKYLDVVASLDSVCFHSELKEFISAIKHVLFSFENESEIIDYLTVLYELKSLVGLHITNADFEKLSYYDDVSEIKSLTSAVLKSDLSGKVNWNILEQAYKLAVGFYYKARERDSFMVDGLLAEMGSLNCNVGVIIAGGFHQKGICDNLNENKINYVSVKPSLIEVKDNNRYIALIKNIRTPLERWASGSTLAVASWLAENPLVNQDLKQAKTTVFSSMLVSSAIKNMVPNDLVLLRGNLSDFIDRAQIYLDAWMKQYAPQIKLNNLVMIKDRFAVELIVNGRDIVFLFDTFDSKGQDLPVDDNRILEKTQLGDDPVAIMTHEVAEQIRRLALIEQNIKSDDEQQDGIEKLFEMFGMGTQYRSNRLTITDFIKKTSLLSQSGLEVSLKDYYAALRWLIKNQLDLFTSSDMANITNRNEQLFENFDFNLKPSDINRLAYQFLRQVNLGDGILSVDDFPVAWHQILTVKGIKSIAFQHNIPYEAVVRMLFELIFLPPLEPGLVNLGTHNGYLYQSRNIRLAGGGLMVRIVPAEPDPATGVPAFEAPFEKEVYSESVKVKDGVLLIETDGGFVLSNILGFDSESGNLSYTDIKNNSVSLKRGGQAEPFLRNFIKNMSKMALERGYVLRGVVFRDQGGEPLYFADENQFIDYMKDTLSEPYLPLRQTEWAGSIGNLNAVQMVDFIRIGIILGDIGGGYENFLEIEELIDLKGKKVLDVGSQLGYNVFYAHLKGAEFSAGVDINPYQQEAAREISAYLNENMGEHAERIKERIPDLVLSPGGTTNGQLFFRMVDIKEYEENHNVSLAVKPPDNIELSIADARNLPYEDDSFDVVLSQYMLPYIKNPSLALSEMLRVAKSGAYIKFNYSFNQRTDTQILEEACAILAREHNVQVKYFKVTTNEKYMILRVESKKKTEDILGAQSSGRLIFTDKSSPLPNNFDSKPYLDSLYPPITALPASYNTLATARFDSLASITGINGKGKASLAFTKQMLDRIYRSEFLQGLSTVEISRGASELVSIIDDSLIIDESVLSNPYILFSLVEQTLVSRFINSMPDEFFFKYQVPSELMPLYKDVIFVQYFSQQIIDRFSESEVRQIIDALKGADKKDTALEFQADILGRTLERYLNKTVSTKKLIYDILKEMINLPQYEHLKTSSADMRALFDGETVSLSAVENIENLSWQLNNIFKDSYSTLDFNFELLSPRVIGQAAESVNPDLSIKEYIDFLPFLRNIQKLGLNIPSNLNELLSDEMYSTIFQKYPQVGFYVLKDMVKSVVNDPANPSLYPFFMELDSASIMSVIANVSESLDENLPEFENGVEHAIPILRDMPATAWIGPRLHAKLIELNNGEPYRVLGMELETDDENKFLATLDNIILLNNIQENEIVALKITRKVDKNRGEGLDVYIVVDTLKNIQENSQLVAGFSTFMEHEMSYKKTFSLTENTTKESFISFSPQLQSAGIGSEFMRNEIALFQRAGMVNTSVQAVSKEVRVFSMLEREINAEIVMNRFWDRILPDSRNAQELAALMFRIGVLDRETLDELWDLTTSEEDVLNEIKTLFTGAVNEAADENESFLRMFNRKTREFVRKKARLNEIRAIYQRLADDPFVAVNYPEIRDEYKIFQRYEDLEIEAPAYNMEPVTLSIEQDLIDRIPEFEENLLSYVRTDVLSNVIIPNTLFVPSNDLTETYGEFVSYVSRILPFIDLSGVIPARIRHDNTGAHIGLIFRTAAYIAEQNNPNEAVELLRSGNVWNNLAHRINIDNKNSVIRQALQSLFYSVLREKTLSTDNLKRYFSFFNSTGLFKGELLENSGQWTINVIKTNPKGAGVLFLSLANLFIGNPREATDLFIRLMDIEGADFVDLVHYAASVDSDELITQLPDLLTLFESGLRGRIQSLNGIGAEEFGRLNLLLSNKSVISPDILDPESFIIQIQDRQTDENGFFTDAFSSIELARALLEWLNSKGVEAELMKGVSIISGEEQFFIRIGNLDVGISPFAEFINPVYKNVASVGQTELQEVYEDNRYFVSLSENQPLVWRNLNKQMEMYFTGKVQVFSSNGYRYIDFTVESKIRNGDGTISPQKSTLRVPQADLFDLYQSVVSNRSDNALQAISMFKHANLTFTSTTDDLNTAKFRANYFNDIFYQIIARMDLLWMFERKLDSFVDGLNGIDPVSLADKMRLAQYGDLPEIAQQVILKQQAPDKDTAELNTDRFHVLNTLRGDFSVIVIDSFPVGWVLGQEIYLMEPLRHAELFFREKIAQREGHSFSPFVTAGIENTSFTSIAVFNPSQYGSFNVDVDPAVNKENFDAGYYTESLSRALINAGMKITDMFNEKVSVRIVQGHWRLGDRQVDHIDGKTVLVIDIDAFRDPFLLEFVVNHELVPHFGAAGEAHALMNDVFAFGKLSQDRQQHLLEVLRNDNIDLHNFAAILEKSKEISPADSIKDIIAYISDAEKYPQLSLELKGMSEDEVYRYLSGQFNDELASKLESMGHNPLDVAKLTLHPNFYDLSLALEAVDKLESNPVFPQSARQTVISYLLDNKLDAGNIAQAFYDMDTYDTAFKDLFFFFGPEIIPVLLKNANSDETKLKKFENFMVIFGTSFGDMFTYSVNRSAPDQYLRIVIETGSANIERFYKANGDVYVENVHVHVDWYNAIPEQTEEMAVICEEFFGKNIENTINILERFLENPQDHAKIDDVIKNNMDKLTGLVSQMMDDYRTVKTARKYLDLRNIPLSKQEISIEINTQFVSDLIGSPISMGLGMIQIAEAEINDARKEQRDINYEELAEFIQKARDSLSDVRQLLIRYRMMKNYRVALHEGNHMIKFSESLNLDANRQIREQEFYPESAVAEQIKSRVKSENDVYVVYFSGHETNSIRFISDIMADIDTEKPVRIVIVSPNLDTDVVESLLSEFSITQAVALIIGKDILGKSDTQTASGSDIVSLIQNNVDNPPDNVIFLADQTRVFSDLMSEGLTVLPLPDIKQTPKPYSPSLGSKAVIDQAA